MQTYSFARSLRLVESSSFSRVFKANNFHINTYCLKIRACSNNLDVARLGIIVAKRNIKFAHDRNRIKRIIRESFRLHQHKIPCVDCVVCVKSNALKVSSRDLQKCLDHLWQKCSKTF